MIDEGLKKLSIRCFDSIGCTVASTAVIYSLKDGFPRAKLEVHTKYPELFKGIERIIIKTANNKNKINFDIDLSIIYEKRRPHNTKPYRPLYIHMIEIAEKQLSAKLKRFIPAINLSKKEINWANEKIKNLEKPLIWIQSKTNSVNKNWFEDYWKIVFKKLNENYEIIDLANSDFSLRQSLAITKVSEGGITLDTFLIHGSAAVGAKNVLVLLGSSRKEVVSYPSQTVIYLKSDCSIQPCGMHGYGIGCEKKDEKLFTGHEKTRCIFDNYRCMRVIKPELVISKLLGMLKTLR